MKRLITLGLVALGLVLSSPASAMSPKKLPANAVVPAPVKAPKVVFHMKSDDLNAQGIPVVIELAERLNGFYMSKKVKAEITVVVQDDAAYWMLADAAFAKAGKGKSNKVAPRIAALAKAGVSFEICMADMKKNGWTPKDLGEGVKPLMGAIPRLIELQGKGWTYLAY